MSSAFAPELISTLRSADWSPSRVNSIAPDSSTRTWSLGISLITGVVVGLAAGLGARGMSLGVGGFLVCLTFSVSVRTHGGRSCSHALGGLAISNLHSYPEG